MTSSITKYNLEKDKKVLGKKWLTTYGGWFSDEENIQNFIDSAQPFIPKGDISILYVASASGLLGERLIVKLGRGHLTIVDIGEEHLKENKNPLTIKIKADLLNLDLKKQFDLIIMRSSLDYFPSSDLQIKVLKNIVQHMTPHGVFINQPAFIEDLEERNCISRAYNSNNKIGKRFFQSSDLPFIYSKSGLSSPKKIGEGKIMEINQKDHIDRYDISDDDIDVMKNELKDVKNSAMVTNTGYIMKFSFPIFLSYKV